MARGSVKKRGKTWTAIYYAESKQVWKGGFKRRMDAEAFLDSVNTDIRDGTYLRMPDIPFKQFAEEFLASHKNRVRPSTLRYYNDHLNCHIVPYFKNKTIKSIRPVDVERFLTTLIDGGLSPNTAKKNLITLKTVLKKAMELGYIARSPAQFIKPPKAIKHEMEALTTLEIELLLASADERYKTLFMMASHTGLRLGEIKGLVWDDIDFNSSYVFVRPNSIRDIKSASSKRKVPLPHTLLESLKAHQFDQKMNVKENPHDLVFCNRAGKMFDQSDISKALRSTLKLAGLRMVRFHDLRHSFASILLSSGENLKYVSTLLGHADAAVTLRVYSHVLPEVENGAHNRFESYFKPQAPVKEPI